MKKGLLEGDSCRAEVKGWGTDVCIVVPVPVAAGIWSDEFVREVIEVAVVRKKLTRRARERGRRFVECCCCCCLFPSRRIGPSL